MVHCKTEYLCTAESQSSGCVRCDDVEQYLLIEYCPNFYLLLSDTYVHQISFGTYLSVRYLWNPWKYCSGHDYIRWLLFLSRRLRFTSIFAKSRSVVKIGPYGCVHIGTGVQIRVPFGSINTTHYMMMFCIIRWWSNIHDSLTGDLQLVVLRLV